jgi:hypothetical protein
MAAKWPHYFDLFSLHFMTCHFHNSLKNKCQTRNLSDFNLVWHLNLRTGRDSQEVITPILSIKIH